MAGLQRSVSSFRRQGSSGLVWDDKLLAAELKKEELAKQQQEEEQKKEVNPSRTVGSISTLDRSRSNRGERAFRTDEVSPAVEPPSPKVSACGFCSALRKPDKTRRRRRPKFL